MPRPTHVLIVRHGESTWNADGRWQGQADPPLTARGRDQARAAAESLPAVDLVVTSDLRRAADTAALLAGPARTVTTDVGLRERDAGAFSGLRRDQIHERHPGLLPDDPARAAGTEGHGLIAPPGWEPDASLLARAWAALDRLAAALEGNGGGTGLAVSHSGLIYGIEISLGAVRERIPNLGSRWLHRVPDGWALGERQLLLGPEAATATPADQL
ncbi:hypothetical protein BH24ACT4_BH24ACT4_13990 [soil metagenome]